MNKSPGSQNHRDYSDFGELLGGSELRAFFCFFLHFCLGKQNSRCGSFFLYLFLIEG